MKARPLLSEASERDTEAERALLGVLPQLKAIWSKRIHALMKARIEAVEDHWQGQLLAAQAQLEEANDQIGQAIINEVKYKANLKRFESKVTELQDKLAHPPPNWGEVLQFTREEIEVAYRRQAKEHHPDRGGQISKMKEINAARERALSFVQQSSDRVTVPEHVGPETGDRAPEKDASKKGKTS